MLHYRVLGEGVPVLILHGSTLDHRSMMDVMEPGCRGAGPWRRLYVDLPGHGLSPARDSIASQDDLLNAMLDFVDAVLPGQDFVLAGLSRGSFLARGIVYRRPERVLGVALIVPGGNPSSDPARLPEPQVLVGDQTVREGLEADELQSLRGMFVREDWDLVEKRRQVIVPAQALFDTTQEARVAQAFDFSFAADEAQQVFDGPSVIVAGRQDSMSGYLDAMDLMHRYTRATLAVLDGGGHGVTWERPEVFHAVIRDWLERVAQAG